MSALLLVTSGSALVQAQGGNSLADLALQAEDINQAPGALQSYLSRPYLSRPDLPDRLVGGYTLWEADHVYVSNELYRYSNVGRSTGCSGLSC